MFRNQGILALAALVAAGIDVVRSDDPRCVVDESHKLLRKPRVIDPPQRYRETRIKGSYDDNVAPRAVKDPEAMSAAEAKRARKAAKRLQEMKR